MNFQDFDHLYQLLTIAEKLQGHPNLTGLRGVVTAQLRELEEEISKPPIDLCTARVFLEGVTQETDTTTTVQPSDRRV